ncbi:lachesin-like [Choristoneura fumiferana]|uniref:lachesin-like n=1 Tax=Choristoneura fumiferana TaxID=7141 RepID=UPI003D159B0E
MHGILIFAAILGGISAKDGPKFVDSGSNVTVVVGRDTTLTCKVDNLNDYKVAWLRVDTQTILTIGPHVITKNHRVGVARGDAQVWALTLRDVRPADGGDYMCQINTEPMITQTHHLQVVVPPDIVDSGSSGEVMVREGENVSIHCAALGTPPPTITWRREDSGVMKIGAESVNKWSGVWLNLSSVVRDMSGALLCIASNGVPPSVSKRIPLRVLCKPSVAMTQKMIGGYLGQSVTLVCRIEAYPTPGVHWTHINVNRIQNGTKYQAIIKSNGYKHTAALKINDVSRDDIGAYQCHAENVLGSAQDDITLYTLATTTITTTLVTTTKATTVVTERTSSTQPYMELETTPDEYEKIVPNEDTYVVVLSQHQMQNLELSPSL